MGGRPPTVDDIHAIARSLPGVTEGGARGQLGPTVYQVSRRSFIFFRNPRPDAVDPDTGERYPDVIVFWVGLRAREGGDPRQHLAAVLHHAPLRRAPVGAPAGLTRGELSRDELATFVEGAWRARAGPGPSLAG